MNKNMLDGRFKLSPYVPYNKRGCSLYTANYSSAGAPGVTPYTYTGWRDEQLSWYDNCYIHAVLNPTRTYWFKGPDALRFLNENLTNSFKSFEIGRAKHGIMVNKDGLLMIDGLLLRLGEDEFITYWMAPYLDYAIDRGSYDVEGKDLTGDVYMYQLGGPRSLEIIEAATREDFHDLPFAGHCLSSIAGKQVRVMRIGMAGSLAYEVHGNLEDALTVYAALLKAGETYAIRRLGRQAYWNAHTENGFPQYTIHFYYAWETDQNFMNSGAYGLIRGGSATKLTGSYSTNISDRYVNPFELSWGFCVNFEHDFVGKEALIKIKSEPHRQMRTLVWNQDDIIDIYRSEFEKGEPYFAMDGPEDAPKTEEIWDYRADQILVGNQCVGMASGRCFSWYYREMISLAIIDPKYAELGTRVEVLWGDQGARQKRIRAIVSRFPYMDINRNESFNVSFIPSGLQ